MTLNKSIQYPAENIHDADGLMLLANIPVQTNRELVWIGIFVGAGGTGI